MSSSIVNKQRYLVHSNVYSKAEVKKYRLSIPADTSVTTEMFFGSKGYNSYVQNGHGAEDVELLDDVTPEEAKQIKEAARKGYAGNDYVGNSHGVSSGLDSILAQIDAEEGNDVSEWQRSPFTISSMGRLDTPELRQQMANIMAESFSRKGNIVWYPIVSIESYRVAESMKLFKDEDYEAVILESLPKWFRSVKLDPDNMLWTADYHNNTDNPHLHLIFLEKVQHRKRGNFSLSDLNNLKEQFYSAAMKRSRHLQAVEKGIEDSFDLHPELKKLHEQMDETNRKLKNSTKTFISKKMDQKIDQDIYRLFNKIDEATMGKGKISMNSKNMAPFRKDILKIVDEVLEHPVNKDLYEEAKENWKKLDQETKGEVSENADRYQVSEDEKLRTSIGNSILQLKKDFDEAYYRSHLESDDGRQLSSRVLKLLRNKYLKSRSYRIEQRQEENPGFSISFKDDTLQFRFMKQLKDSKTIKLLEIKKTKDNEIHFEMKADDENHRHYNNNLFKRYTRALLNNLQDYPEKTKQNTQTLYDLGACQSDDDRQRIMIDYIALNGRQPDNEFFFRQKKRMFYRSYTGALSAKEKMTTDSYGQNSQSNSLLVLSGLNRLLSQRVHNTIAAQKVKEEAEQYWENQQYLDQKKKQQQEKGVEYDAEITY